MGRSTGKLADPAWREERARKAALARQMPRAHISALIRQAGQLTAEDIDRLRVLLPEPGPDAEPLQGATVGPAAGPAEARRGGDAA